MDTLGRTMTGAAQIPEPALREAAADARFLLGRGYPRQRALDLVGDRHGLNARDRQLLRRGALDPALAQARRAKMLPLAALASQAVALDGHNQIITLEAALKGEPLVLADDGAVRDIQGLGPRHAPGPHSERAARLLLAALAEAAWVLILLDAPLSKSGELAARLRVIMAELGLAGQAQAVPAPERQLLAHPGPVASSDGALIDAVARPVDLAGQVIQAMRPAPPLLNLS